MNTAQGKTGGSKPVNIAQPVSVIQPVTSTQSKSVYRPVSSPLGKEGETPPAAKETAQEVVSEIELNHEVKEAGVEKRGEVIVELPPDVKKLGVTQTGATTPLSAVTSVAQVSIPITDSQVVVGLHAKVTSSLAWLAQWCIKKLKKAHVVLKIIHGKIVRVKAD